MPLMRHTIPVPNFAWRDETRQIRNMHSLVRNVSGGGALVLSYRPLPVGAFIRIRAT